MPIPVTTETSHAIPSLGTPKRRSAGGRDPLRIALVTHNVVPGDGQGRVNYEIVQQALRRGHSVTLLADTVDDALTQQGAAWIPIHPRHREPILAKVWEFARQADRILRQQEKTFDIVHGCGFCLSRPHAINTAHFVHSAWLRSPAHEARQKPATTYGLYQRLYSVLNSRWERRAYRNAQTIVAISRQIQSEVEALGIPRTRTRVIWNGANLDEFHPIDDGDARHTLRAHLDLPTDPKTTLALFAGDIRTGRKNLDTVLRAIARMPRGAEGTVQLVVVGNTEGSPYPRMAEELGISDRVRFLGFRRDIADIMRAVDIFVFPAWYEPFGLVILEAMASGLPIITTGGVGAAEVMPPGSGVLLANPADVEGIARALQALVEDRTRRTQMGAMARDAALVHTWEAMADHYLDLYTEILQSGA